MLTTAAIIFLVMMIIFLVLAAVFIGLYVRARGLLTTCQANLSGFTCPSTTCPICPTGTTASFDCSLCPGNTNSGILVASGTAKGEQISMECPLGSVITSVRMYTKVVDGPPGLPGTQPINISSHVNADGRNTYVAEASRILDRAGITPILDLGRNKRSATRILYGAYTCGEFDDNCDRRPRYDDCERNSPYIPNSQLNNIDYDVV